MLQFEPQLGDLKRPLPGGAVKGVFRLADVRSAKGASDVRQGFKILNKPVKGRGRPSRRPQGGLTEAQTSLLSHLNREAADIAYARLNAARKQGLWNIWETIGEQEVVLRPPSTDGEVSFEYARALRALQSLELKLDMSVLADLRSGELLAFGLRRPIKPSSVPVPIPPGLWYLIAFDIENRTAEGGTWSFQEVRTISLQRMNAQDRGQIALALKIIAQGLEVEAAGPDAVKPVASGEPMASPLGATPTNPLYVSIAAASERLVLKTEALRRNTRHGKLPKAKAKTGKSLEVVAEVLPPVADPEAPPKQKKTSGPQTLNPEIEAYLKERSGKKICMPEWLDESIHLHGWAKGKFMREIRSGARVLAKLKWLREVHAALYYELNPEFDRRQRFRQESS